MTDPPGMAQFQDWLDRHGPRLADWPADRRSRAQLVIGDARFVRLLDDARTLATRLDSWQIAPPEAPLIAAIDRSAPRRTISAAFRLWWSGLAMAATLAGAVAGSVAAAAITPSGHDAAAADTVFGDVGGATE